MRAVLAAALLLLTGCTAARVQLVPQAPLVLPAGRFLLEAEPRDHVGVEQVRRAIEQAGPRLAAWGGLRERVHVRVMPTHDALEQAVNRPGYAWLRAWARYGEIFIQSPVTWGVFGARDEDVAELMLHELTHCVMYQASGTSSTWARKGIPLWFREGMASWTARQAGRWMTLESLAASLERLPEADPLGATDALYRTQDGLVYAAAHHAFTYLVRTHGEDKVRAVLVRMGEDVSFSRAFPEVMGMDEAAFIARFRQWLLGRRFRGEARPPGTTPEWLLTP
ncbi:MAG: hypothetical protein FJ086_10200 [Deltaproteobacteria bacterium]|nr:hypothetical protein [Deltaproteobacteria bacterium]